MIYNGIGGSVQDGLVTRVSILRDARVIGAAPAQDVRRLPPVNGVAVIPIVGSLNIANLAAGKYAVQVDVNERRCRCGTSQTVDIELR